MSTLTAPLETTATTLASGQLELTHWGVISAQGDDAATFLHGQLTQDFVLQQPHQARLAAYCSPKGRVLATFIAIKPQPDHILLACPRDVLPAMLKRLSMFVMRAKVRLTDASAQWRLLGRTGSAAVSPAQESPAQRWSCWGEQNGYVVQLAPADSVARQLVFVPSVETVPSAPELSPDQWLWGEVRSGVASVGQAMTDALVPQMINYESVDGVNFKKGCYPGQEVVARSQFRGTLKRRTVLVTCTEADAGTPAPGQEVFDPESPDQPAGVIVQAALRPNGGWDALACLQLAYLQEGTALRLGTAQGSLLKTGRIPYALRDDL